MSGYEVQGSGRYFGLARESVEMQFLYPGSLILMEKTENEVNSTWEMYNYLRKLRLKTILEKYQINTVLDVGANEGQFAKELRNIDYKGRIISFEPISSTFEVLNQAAQSDPNWDVYKLALGRQTGEQKIYVADTSVFTSFLKSNSWCEQEFGKSSVGSREETVTVRRLDEMLNEILDDFDQARMYLKMDTQGYDLEVFSGLGSLCESIVALQTEMSVIPIYQNMPHLTESILFFENTGFELAGMYPVNLDRSTLRVIEFDCLMVNSRICVP